MLEVLPPPLTHATDAVRASLERIVVEHHNNSVRGDLNVGFDVLVPKVLDGMVEGVPRVLRPQDSATAMGEANRVFVVEVRH